MEDYSRFSGIALAKGFVGAVAGSSALCALAWLLSKVPLSELVLPWLFYSGLGALSVPFLYWSMRRQARMGDWRPFFVVFGALCMVACPLLFYYGAAFGFVPRSSLPGLYVTTVICVPLLFPATYYVLKKVGLLPPGRLGH